ncbi:TPA: topoisomerase C-terminal repeat-containing protein [Enterococcus faecalis]|nr:topoisomerase C-terminal repeat-containing protein [Enterococcus faecalis]
MSYDCSSESLRIEKEKNTRTALNQRFLCFYFCATALFRFYVPCTPLPKKWSGKTIPKSNVQQLLEKGITSEIKGFKSKKGKAFNAKLKIVENKITFDFDK